MTMTQSYYGGEFDAITRGNHRAPTAAHYDRPLPYTQYNHNYYESPHPELRPDYSARAGMRAAIHEHAGDIMPPGMPPGHSRRRIQVACSRCRRRKIKCTGDPGDGSGCSACRSAGADKNACTFIRVGSHQLPVPAVDMIPASTLPASNANVPAYGADATVGAYDTSLYQSQNQHRPSLPTLQTRTAYPEYDNYNTSPLDEYTYASSTVPRQSVSSAYNTGNFRPWTSGSVSAPVTSTSMYYEPGAAFSFGDLHAAGPFPSTPTGRLPSVTAEAFSSLNMASLHSSLPTQTVQERRLPVPYTQSYQQSSFSTADVPQIRPLGSVPEQQPRVHISGIHSRHGMPWSHDGAQERAVSRSGSMNSISAAQYHGLPMATAGAATNSSLMTEPILGYQFGATSSSPAVSPTSGPALSESFPNTSSTSTMPGMLAPFSSLRASYSNYTGNDDQQPPRPSSSREAASTSLYSYSSGVDKYESRQSPPDETPTPQHRYAQLRHPQPQHAASLDELRRRASHDQRAATAHRMSVSNLNARY
ncbi:transcriptional regulatory [Lecanosticta acicola]|uniref:Transcriptional regulatory n=1 Tax=Lecanosticta acicola TaxID=111012 RepID=A0AAI8VV07_9PEZI|nr:transcriptional regulatory [Lecanosticta acicola]